MISVSLAQRTIPAVDGRQRRPFNEPQLWDNAVMESFLSSIETERTVNKISERAMRRCVQLHRTLLYLET